MPRLLESKQIYILIRVGFEGFLRLAPGAPVVRSSSSGLLGCDGRHGLKVSAPLACFMRRQ